MRTGPITTSDFALSNLSVCFLAGTLGPGGAERQLYYMVQKLVEEGSRVKVLSLTHGESYETEFRSMGVSVEWIGQKRLRLGRLCSIFAAIRQFKPDVVQSQHFYANLYTAFVGQLLGILDVGAVRGNLTDEIRLAGRLGKLCLHLPHRLAINSQAAFQKAHNLGIAREKLRYLPNVVDCKSFYPLGDHDTGKCIHILTVGRLIPLKRMDRFISLVSAIKQGLNNHGIRLEAAVVGEGPEREYLEHFARQSGLHPSEVKFIGFTTSVAAWYQWADIFVLTSSWEGTPNVLLEAMASGLPVVTSDIGEAHLLVEHGETGFVINDEDSQAINILISLVTDLSLRHAIGKRARTHICNNYSRANLTHILHSFYNSLFQG